jgi:hypothetical protein
MYDKAARVRLTVKIEYELWLLEFLSDGEDAPVGDEHRVDMRLSNRDSRAHVYLRTARTRHSRRAVDVMNAMSPLIFAAAYKTLDMIFEWILEENCAAGAVAPRKPRSRLSFDEKTKCVAKLPLQSFPPLMRSTSDLKERLTALHRKLLGYRHEIVHRSNFSTSGGKLRVIHDTGGHVQVLDLARDELYSLARGVAVAVRLLIGSVTSPALALKGLYYYLDQVERLHGLGTFGQQKPILLNVQLGVPEEGGAYPADLGTVRGKLRQTHPNCDVLFNLTVVGLVDGEPSSAWHFPCDSLPDGDEFILLPGAYQAYATPIPEDW